MKRRHLYFAFAIFISILILQMPRIAQAQSPAISNGLTWLNSVQAPDGSWGSDVTSTDSVQATSAAMESLAVLNSTGSPNYVNAANWLTAQQLDTTRYLSERLQMLPASNTDQALMLSYIDDLARAWGGYSGYTIDNLDTAFALLALKKINYSNYTVLGQAVNFLITNQNADGGWSFTPTDSSHVDITSTVLKTLSLYNGLFNNQDSINKASAFLLSHHNSDGGFGNSPSNVYDTALAFDALVASGANISAIAPSAINYLTSTQLADGSWDEDPYSTALALRALASARANLVIASNDISLSKSMPQDGETITITATVHNTGFDSAANIIVRFFLGDPAAGGTQIGADQVISTLPVGGTAQASITASITGTGGKTIFVMADPHNLISETSKADNKSSTRIWVATAPDLAVFSEDLKPSTYVPTSGTAFSLEYKVRNLGETEAGTFTIGLYDGDPAQGGTLLQIVNLSGVPGSDVRTGTIGVTLTGNGSHTLYLVADSANQITELSKTNNIGTVTVTVGGTLTMADLAVAPIDITLTPSRPHAGDLVQISARIRNQGADAANNFTMEIFDGAPESGGTLIASQTISLVAGGEQTVTANWPIPAGIHDLSVILDRMNGIIESNETNNRASTRVMTDMVDISISATDLVFSPSHPVVNDTVALTITAHNTGIKQAGAFSLALYDGDPASGGVLLQTFPVGNLPGDGSTTLIYTFTAVPWTYRFYAVADTENVVTELYEDNNTAIRSLKIKAPGEILGPDLVPVKIDLSGTTTNPQTLAISGNALVTLQNKGDDKITASFDVIIFEDKNNDGRYTSSVDTLLGTGTNALSLWPEGASMVDVPLSGTVQFLHSPLHAFVDSGDAILEQDETNNILASCKDCEAVPTNPIEPVVKWTKAKPDYVSRSFIIANLNGNNDTSRLPAIIYKTDPTDYNGYTTQLFALDGRTGNTIFIISPDSGKYIGAKNGWEGIAAGDIDGDGYPEIVVPVGTTNTLETGLRAYDHNGNLKWDNIALVNAWNSTHLKVTFSWGSRNSSVPIIADIDADGTPEIIDGATVMNSDGSIRWVGDYSQSGSLEKGGLYYPVLVADIDLDGKKEIVTGNTAYNYDGTIKWRNQALFDGHLAIANFNDDPYPELVMSRLDPYGANTENVYLLDHNGQIKWGPVRVSNFETHCPSCVSNGLAPVVADFDGDGAPEIGIRGYSSYFILDKDGNLKNKLDLPVNPAAPNWGPSWYTEPTAFDLNGDGRPEIIMNGDAYFKIFDGKTGAILYQDGWVGSTYGQGAVVADVDDDGHAEIVVTGMGRYSGSSARVYGARNNDWVGARGIWNQESYHVTNVNDDGTMPQYESPSWLLNNTYRTQAAIGPNPNPYLTPNLTASYMRVEQNGSSINLAVRVGNGGAIASSATVAVTFYDGDPSTGTVIGTASTTRALNPGEYQDVIYSWSGGGLGLHHIYAVVDAANTLSECRKDDNQTQVDLNIQVEYADLKIGPEDITIPAGPYYEGIPVPITVNVKNIGALPASNVVVRLYNGNPSSGGVQISPDQIIPSINAGGSVPLVFSFDSLGKSGMNVLYVVVDPANAVAEVSKMNNIASVTLTVQQPVLPDLAISASDIQLAPASPLEGEQVTVTVMAHNFGTAVGNIPVGIYLGNPASGGVLVSQPMIYPILAFNTTTAVQAVIDTTGWAGQQQLYIVIDPANAIAESRKDNNSESSAFFVQSAGLAATLSLDNTSYQADTAMIATMTAMDTTGYSRPLTLGLFVKDNAGNTIATISTADPVVVGPNGSTTLSRTWNTGTALAGQYAIVSELSESGRVISRKSAEFTIIPDTRMSGQVTTDKISYNPNETAALTAVVTSQSRNTIFGNLTATLTIASASTGTVFIDTKTITTLMPGATFTFKDYWSTGTWAPGTYPVTLTVKDSTGAVIATGTQNLIIASTVKPSALLKGQISVDKQSLLSGETASVSYNVTNTGNSDLSNVALSVLTVHVVNQTVYDTLTSQATLSIGATYTNTGTIDTTPYTAKDYLVILRANINGTEETLAGTYFRIEGAPTAPALVSPAAGSDVETLTPALTVSNASDPNNDKLFYEFELYADSGLTQLVASSGAVSEAAGSTSYQVPAGLQENATYFWRSRASDGKLYGAWMTTASFRVNTANDPPTAPTVSSPADNTSVATLMPVLTVGNAADPDSSNLTYNFDVALDPDFTQIVASMRGVFSGQGTTSWQVPANLQENATYYWRAQADDWLIEGPWSTPARFFVNTANDAPAAPAVIAPANGSTITALSADIVINNSTDPDSPILSYFFEIDSAMVFDSPNVIRSGIVPEGQGTTIWHVAGLQDNTRYHVRVKASDGTADSPWSPVVSFFANTANDAPTTPVLANPSNGAGVNSFTPILSVQNAFDTDHDVLTYEFEVYSDAVMADLVAQAAGIVESPQVTSWTVPILLAENLTYYWRARAFDGALTSGWMPIASFMINTANDAPNAPRLSSPAEGSSIATLYPTLAVVNSVDPDSDRLTYDFEVYSGGTLVTSLTGVPEDSSGITSMTLNTALSDNTAYQWRARAFDGDRSGPWMNMAAFTIHIPQTNINATINFDPDTLKRTSNGTWVVVYIELPAGHTAADIDISSVRLEETVLAEQRSYAVGDHDKDGIPDLMVKFKRSDVINLLPDGDSVPVRVTGRAGSTTFEGIDIIRVIP
jgi:subtilase family serine protease/prenyltransferase beta subunit